MLSALKKREQGKYIRESIQKFAGVNCRVMREGVSEELRLTKKDSRKKYSKRKGPEVETILTLSGTETQWPVWLEGSERRSSRGMRGEVWILFPMYWEATGRNE